jgi:phospholipid/cholesterol/gamma-HCH transport system substrate-binding protein
MDERVMRFRVGVMVLATLIITAILAVMFGEFPEMAGTYKIYVRFPEAPGVTVDTPVRKSGILIGRVSNVEFASDVFGNPDQRGVIVTLDIDRNRKIYGNELCRVRTTLLGDAEIQFVLAPQVQRPEVIGPGQTSPKQPMQGQVMSDPMTAVANLEGQIAVAVDSIAKTSDEMRTVVVKVRDILEANEGQINHAVVQADRTLAAIQQTADYLNQVVGDEDLRRQLKESMTRMPQLIQDAQRTVGQIGDTMALMDRNLRNIEGFTQPLGERGEEIIVRLGQGTDKLNAVMEELATFSRALNNPNGTIGQLANNPELYQRLCRAAENVDELTRQLKPIVADARVISDKVARHPGVILRDAVRPGPGIK